MSLFSTSPKAPTTEKDLENQHLNDGKNEQAKYAELDKKEL